MQKIPSQIAGSILLKTATEAVTPEIQKVFDDRTRRHITLTQKYCKRLEDAIPSLKGLVARGKVHDDSKYTDPELLPYVWLTWRYRCKDTGKTCTLPAGMEAKITKATEHHILNSPHHPEYHQKKKTGLINKKDRDAIPDKMIDATAMTPLDLGEMVADWCAMSEERGNTPEEWADKTVGKRWKFTTDQTALIYAFIEEAWKTRDN